MMITDTMLLHLSNDIAQLEVIESYIYDENMEHLGMSLHKIIEHLFELGKEMRGDTGNNEA